MLLVAFKAAPHIPHRSLITVPYQLWRGGLFDFCFVFFPRDSWHSWIWSPVISPLERKHRCRPGILWKILRGRGMPQWQGRYLWRGRLRLLAWKDKQSVSPRGGARGGCNIDAVFIGRVIAKYHPVFICLAGCVWDSCALNSIWLILLQNSYGKFCSA